MGSATPFFKYAGLFGVVIMIAVAIVLLVFGSKIKSGEDLGDKTKTANVFYAFGAMNMIVAMAMVGLIFAGCETCPVYDQ